MNIVLLLSVIALARAGSQLTRACDSLRTDIPFSGYKIEYQYKNRGSFHLYMCRYGRATGQLLLNDSIPYGQDLCVVTGRPCLHLARTKTAAKRTISMFFPGDLIGGIFWRNQSLLVPVAPLLAENFIRRHWVEFTGLGRATVHVPILTTLDIDSPRNGDTLWVQKIKLDDQRPDKQPQALQFVVEKLLPGSSNFLMRAMKNGASLVKAIVRDGTAVASWVRPQKEGQGV